LSLRIILIFNSWIHLKILNSNYHLNNKKSIKIQKDKIINKKTKPHKPVEDHAKISKGEILFVAVEKNIFLIQLYTLTSKLNMMGVNLKER